MFFIMSVLQGQKDIPYDKLTICSHCGSYGRLQVFMTYMYLSLFFIPVFKWNREYWVKTSCCGTVYALDPEIGRRIAAGEQIELLPEHMREVRPGSRGHFRHCRACGYETTDDSFEFCPKCGTRL